MRKAVIAVMSAFILIGGPLLSTPDAQQTTAQRHSCGYHCNPDGSPATPAAPPVAQDSDGDGIIDGSIQQVGRTNVHSGGRTGGFANKRVGCGGCKDHPASAIISGNGLWDVTPMGRTNQFSGGRAGGKAQPRLGQPPRSNFPRYPKSIGWVSYPTSIVSGLWDIQPLAVDGFGRNRGTRPHHPRTSCRCN